MSRSSTFLSTANHCDSCTAGGAGVSGDRDMIQRSVIDPEGVMNE
jgi:hypothetical protein